MVGWLAGWMIRDLVDPHHTGRSCRRTLLFYSKGVHLRVTDVVTRMAAEEGALPSCIPPMSNVRFCVIAEVNWPLFPSLPGPEVHHSVSWIVLFRVACLENHWLDRLFSIGSAKLHCVCGGVADLVSLTFWVFGSWLVLVSDSVAFLPLTC